MACTQILPFICKIGNKCLETFGLKYKPERKSLVISSPYDFKEGPAVNFPGYSQDDISLMKEKAIASTAVTEDLGFESSSRESWVGRKGIIGRERRVVSAGSGFGMKRVVAHARRVSRGCLS
ncbi:hypothetical protein GLAREA_05122 [Glarea lozoyensis ATCC 20868]|uniref:Uncharacterized protein n=1 Tax=Glarea lozoyensis (strain ATCC 20868 / MF5171) TaxID=1116229 RepID=S3DFC6_GLAL2|nr:uncharacterized protein GLAREA_05122 [Glarea lozoyensis ATCC 20868]EPE35784.1 hypothetical protein GLAREA_05122 [Glarea lozoyensis ATCC 20868]